MGELFRWRENMPHVAFYRVVTDVTELDFPSDGTSRDLTFNTTNDIVLNESSARPMVCFQMDPGSSNETPKCNLKVFIRDLSGADRKICEYNLAGDTSRWTMEPIKPEWVRKNADNKLIFKADVDVGRLVIRNVVVFFMRDI
jgi:hypothetical protein